MQLIVGRDWVPEIYDAQIRRQFVEHLAERLGPQTQRKISAKLAKTIATRKKRKLGNPCLLQLTTFAI